MAVGVKPASDRSVDWVARRQDLGPTRIPSLEDTLTRVLLLGSANTSEAARRDADLVINVRVEGIGLLEFHQLAPPERAVARLRARHWNRAPVRRSVKPRRSRVGLPIMGVYMIRR